MLLTWQVNSVQQGMVSCYERWTEKTGIYEKGSITLE